MKSLIKSNSDFYHPHNNNNNKNSLPYISTKQKPIIRNNFSETMRPIFLKKVVSTSSLLNPRNKTYNIPNAKKIPNYLNYKLKKINNNFNQTTLNFCDYIKEANKIIHERRQFKDRDILGLMNNTNSALINKSKEISLNNYILNSMEKKRNDIYIQEQNMQKSMIIFEKNLNSDYKSFYKYIEKREKKLRDENNSLLKYKKTNEDKKIIYEEELGFNKKLKEDLEKIIKQIYLLKNYGIFVSRVFNKKFWLDDLPELDQRNKNYSEITKIILNKNYNLNNNNENDEINNKNYIFQNASIMVEKLREHEEKFLSVVEDKQTSNHIDTDKNNMESIILSLQKDLALYQEKLKQFNEEKISVSKNIEKIKNKKLLDQNVDAYLSYIIEIGGEATGDEMSKFFMQNIKMHKDYDYHYYTGYTLNCLKQKEKIVNKYIEFIEQVENSEDRNIIINIEMERKNENKRKKILEMKVRQLKRNESLNKKSIESDQKFVIKGRIVPKDYPFVKMKRVKKNIKDKNANDMDLLFFNEDD